MIGHEMTPFVYEPIDPTVFFVSALVLFAAVFLMGYVVGKKM